MSNKFQNRNVIPWYFWILGSKGKSRGVVIYFLSRRYGTSPRFFPLYNELRQTDIILFRGSRLPGVDRVYLKLLPFFIICFKRKLQKYEYFIALNSNPNLVISTNMVLNLDDPTYSIDELTTIKNWEISVRNRGFKSSIVCTTEYIHDYLKSNEVISNIYVIPQGHSNVELPNVKKSSTSKSYLNFVYISPTIDIKGDPHEGHNMWDASTLLLDIWPRVTASNARLHLIGRLGNNASLSLLDKRVISYGLISIKECSKLLPNFDVALYPRIHDNAWMPQKLVEYIGAGLPVLAFDLIDTNIVSHLNVGHLVTSAEEFARIIDEISSGLLSVDEFRKNAVRVAPDYSWATLALNFESIFQ